MNEGKIAARYSKALFESVKEKKKLDKVYVNMNLVLNTINENHEINDFLQNPLVTAAHKESMLTALFGKKVEVETIQLFKLLIQNKRELYIQSIARLFIDKYKSFKNIRTATLITAAPVNDSIKKKLIDLVKETYQAEIELVEKIDEKIIGGFILRVDDQQFDASVHTRLAQIKQEFLYSSVETIN
jgi:F-type H+-transporting ATPase subunit delta